MERRPTQVESIKGMEKGASIGTSLLRIVLCCSWDSAPRGLLSAQEFLFFSTKVEREAQAVILNSDAKIYTSLCLCQPSQLMSCCSALCLGLLSF